MNKPTVFVSYSWKDSYYASRICDDLDLLGFEIIRDRDTLVYKQSISGFMKRISGEDYVLLLISDSYLKSTACMQEVLQLGIENCKKRFVFPIIINNADIFTDKYFEYVKFWMNKVNLKEKELSGIDPCNNISEFIRLRQQKEISFKISEFLTTIKDFLLCSPEELWRARYNQIIEKTNISIDYDRVFGINQINQTDLNNLLIKNTRYIRKDIEGPVDLSRYDLRNKRLVGVDFNLSGINFKYSILSSAYLVGAELIGCCFLGADLRGANLSCANLCDADLRGANLVGVKFDKIRIRNADFSYAIMDNKFKDYVLKHNK